MKRVLFLFFLLVVLALFAPPFRARLAQQTGVQGDAHHLRVYEKLRKSLVK